MGVFPPDDIVLRTISLQRWQNDWIKNHKAVNFSGMCSEIILTMIKEKDPEYYESHKKYLGEIKRKETTPTELCKIK